MRDGPHRVVVHRHVGGAELVVVVGLEWDLCNDLLKELLSGAHVRIKQRQQF